MLGNFSCISSRLLTSFTKLPFSKKRTTHYQSVERFCPDQDRRSVSPVLDPNCCEGYQQMTKVGAGKERVKRKASRVKKCKSQVIRMLIGILL